MYFGFNGSEMSNPLKITVKCRVTVLSASRCFHFEQIWGRFKSPHELLNPIAFNMSKIVEKLHLSMSEWDILCGLSKRSFEKEKLWNSAQNILFIHWNMFISITGKNLRTLGHQTFHDDVIKWKHVPRYWPVVWGIHRSPVNSPYRGPWRGALMLTLICARINGWVNNR